jgi:putative inorganic carbon (hco3(-)) transporter
MTAAIQAPAHVGAPAAAARRLDVIRLVELGALVLATPLLLLPSRFSVLGLFLLGVCWLLRLVVAPGSLVRTPADWPMAGLLLMASVSLYPSIDLTLSLPKLYGLLLGFSFFEIVIRQLRARRDLAILAGVLVGGGVAVAAIGLVGTAWLAPKVPFLAAIYAHLPRLIHSVQSSQGAISGIQPNEVAGTLALLLPVALAVCLFGPPMRWRAVLVLAAAAMALTLALTFSRSALLGTAVAVVLIAILRWPRLAIGLPILLLAAGGLLWRIGLDGYVNLVVGLPTGSDLAGKVVSRQEIWDRALTMIQDFPFTGIGLNTFPLVLTMLYPTFVNAPDLPIPHAHNLFLQTAVDLGIPGLCCFVLILGLAGRGLVLAWSRVTGWQRGLVAGLAAGLIAHLIFSLTDAVALGAKPGIFLWLELGAAVALAAVPHWETALPPVQSSRRLVDYVSGFLLVGAATLGALIAVLHLTTLP